MEDSKKTKVLDTAIELFRARGYSSASMQDIAEACGMAKASIYKFYPSKEDLFTAAFVACHQTLLERAAELDREGAELDVPPKEKLRRKVEFQLQYTVENRLFMIDFKELPIAENERFIEAWKRKRAALHAWRRELLIESYGDSIEPYIGDIVAIFRGIHLEYLTFYQQKVIALPLSELAAFIVDRLDAVIVDLVRTAPKPVMDGRTVRFNQLNPSDVPARRETIRELFALLREAIRELPRSDDAREELVRVADMLAEACEREAADPTLIRVLAAYLDAAPELRPYIRQLNFLRS